METNYKEHSNKSGIYKITNKKNGRVYVGSAKHFKSRYYHHIASLRKGTHHNKYLQADFNKCSPEDFLFEVVEVVVGDMEHRRFVEQTYLNENLSRGQELCYNLAKSTVLYQGPRICEVSKETRKKISDSKKGGIPWNKGVYGYTMPPCSEERKKKIGLAHKGRKLPKEQIEKMRRTKTGMNTGSSSPNNKVYTNIKLVSPCGVVYTQVDCLLDFCKKHNLHYKCMWKLLNKKTPSHRKWRLIGYVPKARTHSCLKGEKHPMYGKEHTRETKDKISKKKLGKMKGMMHPNAKVYEDIKLIAPDGTIHNRIECLNEFCRHYQLSSSRLCAVLNMRVKTHKGWKLASNCLD